MRCSERAPLVCCTQFVRNHMDAHDVVANDACILSAVPPHHVNAHDAHPYGSICGPKKPEYLILLLVKLELSSSEDHAIARMRNRSELAHPLRFD